MSSKRKSAVKPKRSPPKADGASREVAILKKKVAEASKAPKMKPTVSDLCAIAPIHENLECSFTMNEFLVFAEHIILKANEELGIIPSSTFNVGLVQMYLAKLFAAYLVKVGANRFPVDAYTGYESYNVPGYLGVVFHMTVHIFDRATGGDVYVVDSAYDATLRAHVFTEGSARCPVVISSGDAEQTFGLGSNVTYSSLDFPQATRISRIISSAFKHVVAISDIAESISSFSSLIGYGGSAIKPVSGPAYNLSLISVTDYLFPSTVICSKNVSKQIVLQYYFEDLPYSPTATINSLCRSVGIEPFKFTVLEKPLSYQRFADICISWLKRGNYMNLSSSQGTCWAHWGNTIPYMFSAFAARCSWVTRVSATVANPGYISLPMKSVKLFPGLIASGVRPTKVHSAVVLPYCLYSTDHQFVCSLQRADVVDKYLGNTIGRSGGAAGTVPNTYVFAGSPPLPRGSNYNQYPLNSFDALASYTIALAAIVIAQTSVLPTPGPTCPCVCTHSFSDDVMNFNSEFTYTWVKLDSMATPIVMGGYDCACSVGSGLMSSTAKSRFMTYMASDVGDVASRVVEAGYRDSAYENFAAANQGLGPGESMMRFFKSRILDGVQTAAKTVRPEDLKSLVSVLQETGYMPVDLDPSVLGSMNGEYNLTWLASALAGAVSTYGVGALRLYLQNRSTRVRAEL